MGNALRVSEFVGDVVGTGSDGGVLVFLFVENEDAGGEFFIDPCG